MSKQAKPVGTVDSVQGYSSWSDSKGFENAMASMNKGLNESAPIGHAEGYRMSFRQIQPSTSVRTGFNRGDYNYFRPDEAIPQKYKDILYLCQTVYHSVPIVRQVVDLMSDFASKGARVVHPNPEIQKYYEAWFDKVRGKHISERFANVFLRLGVAMVRKHTVKLNARQEKKIYRAQADPDSDYEDVVENAPLAGEIPLKYTIYDPINIENLSGPLGVMVGKAVYCISLPNDLKNKILRPLPEDAPLVKLLPPEVIEAARKGGKIMIPADKMSVFHYKKDDWAEWAYPMIYPILKDIIILEKMKLADQTALDGIISKVRVWKLGDLEHKIVPGPDTISKFSEFLLNNVGGGAIDIVWGPAVELLETTNNVNSILGEEKYRPILASIYSGLGVPPSLTGSEGSKGGFTNNAVSLKTLIERLQYVRDTLTEFWQQELENVRKAKGFRFAAQIQFDKTILTDEASEKKLYIELADRNIISYESIRERFGEIPELEERRIKREFKNRQTGKIPPQSDPYHTGGNLDCDLKKIALTSGIVAPSEVGLELEDKKPGEKNLIQLTPKPAAPAGPPTSKKPKGRAGQGRPQGKKDSTQRKRVNIKPIRGVANVMLWANQAQKQISEILTPVILTACNKKNARQLTALEANEAERIKFAVLATLQPLEPINKEKIEGAIGAKLNSELEEIAQSALDSFSLLTNRQPTIEELRHIQAIAYSEWTCDDEEEVETEQDE